VRVIFAIKGIAVCEHNFCNNEYVRYVHITTFARKGAYYMYT